MVGIVLVVEDEILVRLDTADELRRAGYDVVEAESGDEARRVLQQRTDIQLVCTDVRMPGQTNGLELTRWIRANRPELPVIIVSGERTGRDLPPLADATLVKPVNMAVLLERIGDLLQTQKVGAKKAP